MLLFFPIPEVHISPQFRITLRPLPIQSNPSIWIPTDREDPSFLKEKRKFSPIATIRVLLCFPITLLLESPNRSIQLRIQPLVEIPGLREDVNSIQSACTVITTFPTLPIQ